MQLWVVERGTLWALETRDGLPPICLARVEVTFTEAGVADINNLVVAMNLPDATVIQQRLQNNRRCFTLKIAGQVAAYGWVTHGIENVGELERQFNLYNDEAYIWDCGTVPAWRGQRLYSALLSHMIYHLHGEGVSRIWIGASRLNQPSVQGFVNAGFQPVVDVIYRRFYRLTLFWIYQAISAGHPLVPHAYRILLNPRERRFGRLAIGYKS
jgi:GNAT superfamily N-acetyltransferase